MTRFDAIWFLNINLLSIALTKSIPANDKVNDICNSLQLASQQSTLVRHPSCQLASWYYIAIIQLASSSKHLFLITLVCLVCRPFICSICLYFVISLHQIRAQAYSSRHGRHGRCDIPLKGQAAQKWGFPRSFYKCKGFEYHRQYTSRKYRRNINLMQQFTFRLPMADIVSTAPFTCSFSFPCSQPSFL